MGDEVWKRDEPESPCVKICVVNPETGLCIGCRRSVEEISRWARMTADERRAVIGSLPGRNAGPTRRRGGAAARRAGRGTGGT